MPVFHVYGSDDYRAEFTHIRTVEAPSRNDLHNALWLSRHAVGPKFFQIYSEDDLQLNPKYDEDADLCSCGHKLVPTKTEHRGMFRYQGQLLSYECKSFRQRVCSACGYVEWGDAQDRQVADAKDKAIDTFWEEQV